VVFDVCIRYEDDSASFVLGDLPAEQRADMVAHLDSCSSCRRQVAGLATTLDSITAATVPVAPRTGFVDRVLTAADIAGLTTDPVGAQADRPVRSRPMTVLLRRRRTLAILTGTAAVLALLGMAFDTWILLGPAVAVAALDVAYLTLVVAVAYGNARHDLLSGFEARRISSNTDWDTYLGDLGLELLPQATADDPAAPSVVAVGNAALVRFILALFLGWALTPLVAAIRLVRGDLSELERSPLLQRIVALQEQGRSHSLKLLVAGATTVAVAGGGAAMIAAPGLAAAAPAQTYVVHPGDTLSGIAARFGVSTSALAQLNGISNPNFILPGEVIRVGGSAPTAAAPGSTGTYRVRAGDNLGAIADRFGTTVAALAAENHLANPNLIYVGQVLRVPAGAGPTASAPAVTTSARTYTVRSGDTLFAIAQRFGTTVAALVAANHLANPNVIHVGQVLSLVGGPGPGRVSTPTPTVSTPVSSSYVNPFRYGSWSPARIDEGVDWIPNEVSPVVAIGNGVITYSSMDSGWPAGGFISYRLTSGSHAGLYIYVAEHITGLLPVGTVVAAGQRIATALPGYPWTEWGWAAASGPEPAPGSQYGRAPNGSATYGGMAFARFLISLGAAGTPNPGPGSTFP
jgi:LysM repeat protein